MNRYFNFLNIKSNIFLILYLITIICVSIIGLSGPLLFFIAPPSEVMDLLGQGWAFYILAFILTSFVFFYSIKIDPNGKKINRIFIFILSNFFENLHLKLKIYLEKELFNYFESNKTELNLDNKGNTPKVVYPQFLLLKNQCEPWYFYHSDMRNSFSAIYPQFNYLLEIYAYSGEKYMYPIEKKIIEQVFIQTRDEFKEYIFKYLSGELKSNLSQQSLN
jgi:hypothetical protein